MNPYPTLLAAALEYAARGWHVLPLLPSRKAPAVRAWERWATVDPDRIEATWGRPERGALPGIGIACGPSRLVVVDLDQPKPGQAVPDHARAAGITDGAHSLRRLAAHGGHVVPQTWTVRTGRGGAHLYFALPDSTVPGAGQWRNTAGHLGWLIDTRAGGGQVVAPPTLVMGRRYTLWRDAPVAPLPGWLAAALTAAPVPAAEAVTVPLRAARGVAGRRGQGATAGESTARHRAYVAAAVRREQARVGAAVEGGRNHALLVASIALGQLVAGGALPEVDARAVLLVAAEPHIDAGAYPLRQAHSTITSGLRIGANRPRTIHPAAGSEAAA